MRKAMPSRRPRTATCGPHEGKIQVDRHIHQDPSEKRQDGGIIWSSARENVPPQLDGLRRYRKSQTE